MLNFHVSRRDLVSGARYARASLHDSQKLHLDTIPITTPDHAASLAGILHRSWLTLRSCQLGLLRVRHGLSSRMAFLNAASSIAGETMRHSCGYPIQVGHFGKLVSLRRLNRGR